MKQIIRTAGYLAKAGIIISAFLIMKVMFTDTAESRAAAASNTFRLFSDAGYPSLAEDGADVLITADHFMRNAVLTGSSEKQKASAVYSLKTTVSPSDILLLRFTAFAGTECANIKICFTGTDFAANYYVPTQKTQYYLPVTGYSRLEELIIELETGYQKISIGNLELINYHNKYAVTDLKAGMFNLGEWQEYVLPESGTDIGGGMACITDNRYLYSVASGVLTVASLSDPEKPAVIGSLSGLGNTRDLDFCGDGNMIAVTSRENGVYFIDISNKKKPYILSRYDTLEMATGICVYDDYAFICSRYFGTEIVDISNPAKPVLCSVVDSSAEYIDCTVSEGYLYIGVWAQKQVEIYDVTNVSKPVHISRINLDGQGYGCFVKDKTLYVATGYHSRDNYGSLSSPGYGMGNGLEIYDVAAPAKPEWLSTVKIDGRYYYSGNDVWKVWVAGNYAYFSSTYNGVYIYDISNLKAPLRKAHISVRIDKGSPSYKTVPAGRYVFPFDPSEYNQGPILGIALSDGYMYLADAVTGIHVFAADWILPVRAEYQNPLLKRGDYYTPDIRVSGYTVTAYQTDAAIYAATVKDGYIYAACGSGGIHVLDEALSLLSEYGTDTAVKDIKISGNILFTAESEGGIGIYKVDKAALEKVGSYNTTAFNRTFTHLSLTADSRYLIAQAGWAKLEIIDVSDIYNPKKVQSLSTGTMYYRNLVTGLVSGKYAGATNRTDIKWYRSDENGELVLMNTMANSVYGEADGSTAAGKYCLTVYKNGYIYYNPEKTTESDLASLPIHLIDGVKLKGKPSAYGNLLVVSTEYSGTVAFIDITDMDKPKLLTQFTISGNPDVACITDEFILLPARKQGLIKFIKN